MKLSALLLMVLSLLPLRGEESLWSLAEGFYGEGEFAQALTHYESLRLQEGTSAALEYNMGNTLMRLDRVPEAIAHYRRAQWMAPYDPDIAANLDYARNVQKTPLPPLPISRRLPGRLPVPVWQVLFMCAAWLVGLTGLFRTRSALVRQTAAWVLPAGVVVLFISAASLISLQPSALSSEAVARPATLTSRFEPLEDSTEHFSVPGGSIVQILEEVRGWTRIQVGEKTGWVQTPELILLGQASLSQS